MHNAIYNSVVYDALAVPSDLSHVVESTGDPPSSHGSGLRGSVNPPRQRLRPNALVLTGLANDP
jgi:hypothetical protein